MLEEHWLLEKTKHLNSLTVAEIEMRRKKNSFCEFPDFSPRRKIYLTLVDSKIS